MSILDKINSAEDLKKLSFDELRLVSDEIRDFIIENVSVTGGHLASNLGSVELCLALNRVYDPLKDRIVFDVGHQSYTHKIINGRKKDFSTLRQLGGISGFPKPYESDADSFITGHSSTAISVADGFARARTLLGEDYSVCAVLGDGALTGGLAYEGLENIADSEEPILIILNDNAMSIDSNVGGMNMLLQKMRVSPDYFKLKRKYRAAVGINSNAYAVGHKIKEQLKSKILSKNMFTSMGLEYLGPIDGHDVETLETTISWAKEIKKPVLLHVITLKGKGCKYAAAEPEKYHGVGPFNPKTGEIKHEAKGFGDKFGEYLTEFADKDNSITAITAAMSGGTGLNTFGDNHPKRFFDVGIAEGHAVAMAAGMAKQGLKPVFCVYSSFLQRAYDMLIHDVSLQNLHVVFGVDRAGLVGRDGETHHGVFDIAFLSSVPGISILCPASFKELKDMLHTALYDYSGPVAIRYPRGGEGAYKDSIMSTEIVLQKGTSVTIAAYGIMINQAIKAAEILKEKGVSAEVVKIGAVKPCSFEVVCGSLKKTNALVVAEDVCASSSVGSMILSAASANNISKFKSVLLNLGNGIATHGSVEELYKMYSLDAEGIAAAALSLL